MEYQLGQLVAGIISVSSQIIHFWNFNKDIGVIRNIANQFHTLISQNEIIEEGKQLESLVPHPTLITTQKKLEFFWNQFTEVLREPTIKITELNYYIEGLCVAICEELKSIQSPNILFPSRTIQEWFLYSCNME